MDDMLNPMARLAARLHAWLLRAERQRERGDVAAWVLIVVMTAGIVVVLWTLAGEQLQNMFRDALSKVKGPGG